MSCQSEPEKQDKIQIQILEKKFHKVSDFDWKVWNAWVFELKVLQHVTFWIKKFLTSHIFRKNFALKKTFWLFSLPENDIFFHFSCFFNKHEFIFKFLLPVRFWIERNITHPNLNLKKYNASDFPLGKLQRVRFWIESFTTCEILSVFLLQFAKSSCVHQNKARSGNLLLYGAGSVSQFILLGEVLCLRTVITVIGQIKTANPFRVCSSIYLDREWFLTTFY